jgi:hypothetical protein
MMEAIAIIFTVLPYVLAAMLGLALALLCVMCYSRFGAGLAVISTAFGLDVLTQSSPLLNLGITLFVADLPMIFVGAVAGLRWLLRKDIPHRHMGWVIFAAVFFVDLAIGLAKHGTGAGVQARNDFYSLAAASYVMSFPVGRPQVRQLLGALAWLAFALLLLCVYRWTVYYGNFRELLPAMGSYNVDGAIRVIGSSPALVLGQSLILGLFFGTLGAGAKALRGLLVATLGFTLVLQHRSVWLATLVGVAAAVLLAKVQRVSRAQQALLLGALLFVAGVGLMFGGKVTEDIRSSATRAVEGQGTVQARFENWRSTLSDWRDAGPRAILIGREFGNGERSLMLNSAGQYVPINFGAHNIYVSLLTSTGIVGLSALLWAVVSTLRKLYANSRSGGEDAAYDSVLLVLMIMQLVYYVAYSSDFLQFMIFGIALAAAHGRAAPAAASKAPPLFGRPSQQRAKPRTL